MRLIDYLGERGGACDRLKDGSRCPVCVSVTASLSGCCSSSPHGTPTYLQVFTPTQSLTPVVFQPFRLESSAAVVLRSIYTQTVQVMFLIYKIQHIYTEMHTSCTLTQQIDLVGLYPQLICCD